MIGKKWFASKILPIFLPIFLLGGLAGCFWDSDNVEHKYPTDPENNNRRTDIYEKSGSIFGEGGLNLFGGSRENNTTAPGIGVNAYLWRATLSTVSFMPMASADPFGGVIITDWYQPPESQTERFKINIYILGSELRTDGVRAAVFRQRLHPSGIWVDSPVSKGMGTDLENIILSRAREIRMVERVGGS